MYHKILVPLDGSQLAECVLPHVESLARGGAAGEVIFLRVREPLQDGAAGMRFLLRAMRISTSGTLTRELRPRIISRRLPKERSMKGSR